MRILSICVLFGFMGMGMETFVTGCDDGISQLVFGLPIGHLRGYTSAWYFPLYAMTPLVLLLCRNQARRLNWFLRGLIYMTIFFLVEFCTNLIFHQLLGSAPSEEMYLKSPFHFLGFIKLSLAPAWFIAGLWFEHIFLLIDP